MTNSACAACADFDALMYFFKLQRETDLTRLPNILCKLKLGAIDLKYIGCRRVQSLKFSKTCIQSMQCRIIFFGKLRP